MENLDGIHHMLMSGRRATLVLEEGATLSEADVKQAVEDQGLVFESLEKHKVHRAAGAYVAKTPKFT